ncbi:multi-sensor signal transduction histidine kinase [Methylophaga frappieri]|uniref:Multi-sensor signal transduction histidine kinase n=1 Tax=Methylophaga frappieri (strain ATCC BAA-2434 / DSM 25690 / JAM7) TaxID=754477 RepID=I1YI15_METFJ|nr:multi-sensor signal transduction histidine kinase [Methylophaga frappieri]
MHTDLTMTSALSDYLIESQTSRLQNDFRNFGQMPTNGTLSRLFDLSRLSALRHIEIAFLSADGELLDANYPDETVSDKLMPEWFYRLLSGYLHEDTIYKPVFLGGQLIGQVRIKPNLSSEVTEIWQTSTRMILPLMLIYALVSFLIAMVASLILKPTENLLRVYRQLSDSGKKSKRKEQPYSLFGLRDQIGDIGRRLQNYNQELRQLNDKLLSLHEDERKRLAAELHDEIGQHLTAIRFDTAAIRGASDLKEAKQAAQSIETINRELTDIVRSMLQRLRPPSLDSVGLTASLKELTTDWQQRHTHHQLILLAEEELNHLDDTIKLTAYRVVQECLTNISRHAGPAVLVWITLSLQGETLSIEISDNGKGCDLDAITPGIGLLAMRERVETLKGEFSVSAAYEEGMHVSLRIPNALG